MQQNLGGLKGKKGLIRCEFLEFLVRLAFGKYGKNSTFYGSLEILIDHMKKNLKLKEWQAWRERELWTLEVQDVLDTNLQALKKLHSSAINPQIRYFTMQNG